MMGSLSSETQDLGSGPANTPYDKAAVAVEPSSEFNPAEARVLARYFTNLDRPVFPLRNLPAAVKGALFSRYSRTEKSRRPVPLDELINDPDPRLAHRAAGATEDGL